MCSESHRSREVTPRRMRLRQRLEAMRNRQRSIARVCYDAVGCFELGNPRSPLQKLPENPASLDTKFYLFRRNIKFSEPEILYYNDNGISLRQSKFNYSQPLKVIIHGFMGAWTNINALNASHTYLKIDDYNIINMDWSTAAKGPQYAQAAANTEIVGRQLGLLLEQMIRLGLNPDVVHLIGFSLGAHVAACASEILKNRTILLGRITGLDAASPLFRNKHREKSTKLDKSDAKFVDALHTDASPVFVDGFGIWEPIGHVDFFANGGQQQPGCIDRQASILLTHLERGFSKNSTCSHIRAFELFLESLLYKIEGKNNCEFIAFSCPGGMPSYERGQCFPKLANTADPLAIDLKYRNDLGLMGDDARGSGVMYFATKGVQPYCGSQLQAEVSISQKTPQMRGNLKMEISFDNEIARFEVYCELTDLVRRNTDVSALSAVNFNSLRANLKKMQMTVEFQHSDFRRGSNETQIIPDSLLVDNVSVRDMYGNR
ncbi:lipase [Holotrichia oblita]|uniref:Lipase n=1 Tax=Holotrichia oblita TaxID=644536 RepID=A0ACB9T5K5_HOLOL|nr:lipase [Holotrichia oblita]